MNHPSFLRQATQHLADGFAPYISEEHFKYVKNEWLPNCIRDYELDAKIFFMAEDFTNQQLAFFTFWFGLNEIGEWELRGLGQHIRIRDEQSQTMRAGAYLKALAAMTEPFFGRIIQVVSSRLNWQI